MTSADLRLGLDVGGTHTDAVVLDRDDTLLAKAKVPTTSDITSGLDAAIRAVTAGPVDPAHVSHVMIGTTHATNAVLERRGLRKVAVLRIGSPSTDAVRPLFGWPKDLREAVSLGECIVAGGAEVDGREIVPFDADATARFLTSLRQPVEAVAVTSAFSPATTDHELAAMQIIRRELGDDVHVSLSHEIGTLGLLERENATALNEALVGVAHGVATALTPVLAANGLSSAIVYFAQNDGTLMALEHTLHFPVLTIGSGPANSLRGAAYLTGVKDALVIDVGGTSTDVGMISAGFPRESTFGAQIGGIDTNFPMPDLVSIGIGGGSIIRAVDGETVVGPDSVGYRLSQQALAFGGDVATLSDAAIVADRADFGSRFPDTSGDPDLAAGLVSADQAITEAVDRMKTSKADLPLIAVGGGSVVLPDRIAGISQVLTPEHHEVANAIGAAIGTVSGQVDRVFRLEKASRSEVMEEASNQAMEQAVRAGADPRQLEIVHIEEIPLAYLNHPAIRVRVKAAGPLGSL